MTKINKNDLNELAAMLCRFKHTFSAAKNSHKFEKTFKSLIIEHKSRGKKIKQLEEENDSIAFNSENLMKTLKAKNKAMEKKLKEIAILLIEDISIFNIISAREICSKYRGK